MNNYNKAVANSKLYTLHSALRVEIFLKCLELVFALYASFPPTLDEPQSVAHQLDKGGRDAEESHLQTLVLDGGVNQDDEGVEDEGDEEQRCP